MKYFFGKWKVFKLREITLKNFKLFWLLYKSFSGLKIFVNNEKKIKSLRKKRENYLKNKYFFLWENLIGKLFTKKYYQIILKRKIIETLKQNVLIEKNIEENGNSFRKIRCENNLKKKIYFSWKHYIHKKIFLKNNLKILLEEKKYLKKKFFLYNWVKHSIQNYESEKNYQKNRKILVFSILKKRFIILISTIINFI